MNDHLRLDALLTRRALLAQSGLSWAAVALGGLLNEAGAAAPSAPAAAPGPVDPLSRRKPHFRPRAKSIIYLHMVGAPSHLDLFEPKPELNRLDGQPCPQEFIEGKRFAFLRGHPRMAGSRFKFARHGQSGLEVSELLPHLAGVADEITLVRSLHTEEFNHGPAQLFLHTGFGRPGRPGIGAWLTYGLGSANANLPAYVVLLSGPLAGAGTSLWSSGFLPTVYQGIQFRSSGEPVLFLTNPPGRSPADRRRLLDAVQELNRGQLADVGDPEIATRISQYEMAFRMQSSVPELMDLSGETQETLDLYGAKPGQASFANNCLLARRMVEQGVRIIELYDADWDHHGDLATRLPRKCQDVDRGMAALVTDLKRRGLLDETLVVWSGEFGRTPMQQIDSGAGVATKPGRDHHKDAFCAWLAGGGVKAGFQYGRTDDFGYSIVEQPVHVHNLNATLLRQLGIDHERLTFKYQGREYRLTDVHGQVVNDLLV